MIISPRRPTGVICCGAARREGRCWRRVRWGSGLQLRTRSFPVPTTRTRCASPTAGRRSVAWRSRGVLPSAWARRLCSPAWPPRAALRHHTVALLRTGARGAAVKPARPRPKRVACVVADGAQADGAVVHASDTEMTEMKRKETKGKVMDAAAVPACRSRVQTSSSYPVAL